MITLDFATLMLGLIQFVGFLLFILGAFAAGYYFGRQDGRNGL
jgi:hypothetical protein